MAKPSVTETMAFAAMRAVIAAGAELVPLAACIGVCQALPTHRKRATLRCRREVASN